MATAPIPLNATEPKAIELARQADQLEGERNPMIAAILAAAYAEGGRFDQAVTAARRALELATAQKNAAMACGHCSATPLLRERHTFSGHGHLPEIVERLPSRIFSISLRQNRIYSKE